MSQNIIAMNIQTAQVKDAGKAIRKADRLAHELVNDIGSDDLGDSEGRVLVEVVRSMVFDHITHNMQGPDEVELKDLTTLVRIIKDLSATAKLEDERRIKLKAEATEQARQQAAEAAATVAVEKGLSVETRDAILDSILGRAA